MVDVKIDFSHKGQKWAHEFNIRRGTPVSKLKLLMLAPKGTQEDADKFELQLKGRRLPSYVQLKKPQTLTFEYLGYEEGSRRAAEDNAKAGGSRGGNQSRSSWSGGQQTPSKARNSSSSSVAGAGGDAWTTVQSSGRGPRVLSQQVGAGAQALLRPVHSLAGTSERSPQRLGPSPTNGRLSGGGKAPEATKQRDPVSVRNGLRATVNELSLSHDVADAIQRVRDMRIPTQQQASELGHLLAAISEQGNRESRAICFRFAVQLMLDGVLSRSAVQLGLEAFAEKSKDLALDLPSLPRIISQECVPALEELVRAGVLSAEQHQAFAQSVQ